MTELVINNVADFKLAEDILKESEERFQALFERVPCPIIIVDEALRIADVNSAACQLLGYSREELLKLSVEDIHPKQMHKHVKGDINKTFRDGRKMTRELTFVTKDGSIKTIEATDARLIIGGKKYVAGAFQDITERKKAEGELREAEVRYRAQFEQLLDAIFVTDAETGILIDCNAAAAKLVGRKKSEIIGQHQKILHPQEEIEGEFSRTYKQHIRNKEGQALEAKVITRDGKIKHVSIKANIFQLKERKILQGAFRDVTERKQAEEDLRKSEAKYSSLVEQAQEGVIIIQDNVFKFCNKAMSKILGYSMKELIGMDFLLTIVPEHRGLIKKRYRQDLAEKTTPATFEIKNKRKDGTIIDVEVTGSTIYYHNRPAAMCVIRDVTQRKQAEQALRESEKRFRDISENALEFIWEVDLKGKYTYISPIVERILGYKPKELIGKKYFYNLLIPEDRQQIKKAAFGIMRKKMPFHEFVNRNLHKNGKIVWLSTSAVPLFKDGKLAGYRGAGNDISERKKSENKLEALNKELFKSNKRFKQLALRDSHTGLYNHRYLGEAIEAEFYRAKRYGHTVSLVMLDIDYFKSINDVYGHLFGDLVLKQFARLLKRMVRRYDTIIRFGGEEFIIIFSGIDRPSALVLSQRLLDAISLYNFGNKKHTVKLKLTVAVASYPEDKASSGMDLVELADRVLNKAKEQGGDRVFSTLDIIKRKSEGRDNNDDIADVKVLRDKIEKMNKREHQSLIESVFAFARTIKSRDHYTGEHTERIVHYATEIAKSLDLPEDEIECIKQASILHDLGKVGISDKILLKHAKLSKKEFEQIKKHPQIGVDIIRPIQFLHSIIPLILYHHERWDGRGYPKGLKGDDIPIGARIVAVSDVFQALISDRPYRQALSKKEAIKIIKQGSGAQFDPQIVKVFLEIAQRSKTVEFTPGQF
ncbi:PAS domain S-box protein [Candidatus Omnitrophota bacterium]